MGDILAFTVVGIETVSFNHITDENAEGLKNIFLPIEQNRVTHVEFAYYFSNRSEHLIQLLI